MLVLDRENKEQILICTKNDGVYQWTTPGGIIMKTYAYICNIYYTLTRT